MRDNCGFLLLRARLPSVAAVSLACGLALAVVGCAAAATSGKSATPRNVAMAATPRISFARTTTWRTLRVPAPATATDASLTAISCLNATNCVAGGTAYNATAVGPLAFSVTYTHGSWASARILTMPSGATWSQLGGLSCVAGGPCVAVGTYDTSTGPAGFVAEQSGARWGPVRRLRLPADDTIGGLNAVSCTAPGECVAVGSVNTPRSGEMPMVVAEVDGRWQQPAEISLPVKPAPRFGGDQLRSLTCQRTGYCVAVGEYNVTATSAQLVSRPMMTTESAGRWLPARGLSAPADAALIPNAPGVGTLSYAGLQSVSCARPGECLASGSYLAGQAHWRSLAMSYLNGRWSPPQELIPGRGTTSACAIAYCLMAGSGAGPTSPGIALTYSGGRWSQVAAINPPADADHTPSRGYQLEIGDVVCFSGGDCIAAGSYIDESGQREPMVATRS